MRSTRIFQAVPVLQVADVAASARWYRNVLGFDADPFPAKPPYQFAILRHGDTELMLQKAAVLVSRNPAPYRWDVYLRLEGGRIRNLYRDLSEMFPVEGGRIQRRLERMFYGLCEFEIVDLDGYAICLAEPLRNDSDLPTPEV